MLLMAEAGFLKVSASVIPGFEGIAAAEVKELTGAEAAADVAGIVAFHLGKLGDLCRLCYLSQSISSVFLQKGGKNLGLKAFDFGPREYAVSGSSGELPGHLAYCLLRLSGYNGRQVLFDPFAIAGSIAIEAALYSSGFPVNYYRENALKSAFSALPGLKDVDFEAFFSMALKESEAAAKHRLKKSAPGIICASDSMQNVRFAEKNAKIAGVNKLIRFSRLDIEWLDAKLDERSVDLVVSYPPKFKSGSGDFAKAENRKVGKLYNDFFYNAVFFLHPEGRAVFLLKGSSSGHVTAAASKNKFKAKILRKFSLGGDDFEVLEFSR